jgi:hypothetical protein
MKKNYYLVVVLNLLVSFQVNAQQIGNGIATEVTSINTILPSGFYVSGSAQPNYPYEIPVWPWKHLFNLNNGNTCSFQISSPFTHDDRAFFRKVVYNNTNPNCDNEWYEFATRGYNTFTGNQKINGSLTLAYPWPEGPAFNIRNESKTQPGQALQWQILNMTAHHGDALRFIACDQETCNWRFTIMDNGNVGIGIHNPANKLEVDGTVKAKEMALETGWTDLSETFNDYGSKIHFGSLYENSDEIFISRYNIENDKSELRVNVGDDILDKFVVGRRLWGHTEFSPLFTVVTNGNVGIGVSDPVDKFEVNGTIKAKEIKVETGWADHVFSKDYNLPTLKEVKSHIEFHKHLPDIPTEAEVKVSGINLGEMQVKLLQKVEELTLYLIQQQETIDELKNEIKTLKSNK